MSTKKKVKSFPNSFEKLSKVLALSEATVPYEAKISIIMVSFGHQERLSFTLSKILEQDYNNFEVILLDGGEYEKTVETISDFKALPISHYAVTGHKLIGMFNRGIKFAKGRYLVFLQPGEYFLFSRILQYIVNLAFQAKEPKLIFDGKWIDNSLGKESSNLLTIKSMFEGKGAHSLCSIFFKKEVFNQVGHFNPRLENIFLQEWLSRVMDKKNKKVTYLIDIRFFCDAEYLNQRGDTGNLVKLWKKWGVILKRFGYRAFFSYLLPFGSWENMYSKFKKKLLFM
jgi:glycosyltransferase involved in cell wall biosynthesis